MSDMGPIPGRPAVWGRVSRVENLHTDLDHFCGVDRRSVVAVHNFTRGTVAVTVRLAGGLAALLSN